MNRELTASSTSALTIREPEIAPAATRHAPPTATKLSARPVRAHHPKGIARVPTHTVGRAQERRLNRRARLALPIVLQRVAGQHGSSHATLCTRDISSSGVFFLSPQQIDPGTPIELEVLLVNRPVGRGAVRMRAEARVVRSEPAEETGWYGLAVTFDDINYRRDDFASLPRHLR